MEPTTKAVEVWCTEKGTPAWLFASAKMIAPWGFGRELTEAEYDAEILRAGNLQINPA